MTMEPILRKEYPPPPVDEKEILRYAGCRRPEETTLSLLHSCVEEALPMLSYRVCWRDMPVTVEKGGCLFSFGRVASASLAARLSGCQRVRLFAATVGLEMDRLIAKYSSLSPARGLLMQAVGVERVEALCDAFCRETADQQGAVRSRFSPGYGDLPLTFQTTMFTLLDPPRQIGVTLSDSLLMTPTKSVTALIGIGGQADERLTRSCGECTQQACSFRRI